MNNIVEKYIIDGEVKRSRIANDIKYCILSKANIQELVKNKDVKNEFFGSLNGIKKPKDEWDSYHLNEVSNACISEVFNEEYLFYLHDVAINIYKQKQEMKETKTKVILGATIGLIVAFSVCVMLVKKNAIEKKVIDKAIKIATSSIVNK